MSNDNLKYWAKRQFVTYSGSVAFIATEGEDGQGCGTCFHVGEGVFVTARHVIEDRNILEIGFDDDATIQWLLRDRNNWGVKSHGSTNIVDGPYYHADTNVDVACFKVNPFPSMYIPLGGHLDSYMGQHELVLHRTLVLGYPPIPCTNSPRLLASVGEINALIELRAQRHPHFIISTMARGGFSGGPVLVAYDEDNTTSGTALLGLVTHALTRDWKQEEQDYLAVLTVEPIFDCLEQNNLCPHFQGYDTQDT